MHRRRVVITGMGVVTPLGQNPDHLYKALIEGRSGVGPISHFDARTFPTKFAAEVREFRPGRLPQRRRCWEHCGLNTRFAVAAAKQALGDAGLLENHRIDRSTIGIYLGSGEGMPGFLIA